MANSESRARARTVPNERCGPASVKAPAEGIGRSTEEALKRAMDEARALAATMCHGGCDSGPIACAYTEREIELVRPTVEMDGNPRRFKAEVISRGTCECQV